MKVALLFEGPPGPDGPRFIDTVDMYGQPVGIGTWEERPDEGCWALVVDVEESEVRRGRT